MFVSLSQKWWRQRGNIQKQNENLMSARVLSSPWNKFKYMWIWNSALKGLQVLPKRSVGRSFWFVSVIFHLWQRCSAIIWGSCPAVFLSVSSEHGSSWWGGREGGTFLLSPYYEIIQIKEGEKKLKTNREVISAESKIPLRKNKEISSLTWTEGCSVSLWSKSSE